MPAENLFPSLYAPLLHQCRMNPHAIAVVSDQATVTYAEFCSHIERVTRQLQAQAIPAGSRVGVQVAHQYANWLIVFALSRLGLVGAVAPPERLEVLAPDVVIADPGTDLPDREVVAFRMDWIDKPAEHLPPFADRLHRANEQARIVLSSGTTGRPKLALMTYERMHRRNKQQIGNYELTSATRMLVAMGMGTMIGLMVPINVWSAGGTVILPVMRKGQGLVSVLLRAQPNTMYLATAQLENLVANLPPKFLPPRELRVYQAGSALPPELNRRARTRLTPSLYISYGSTEIGTVTLAPAFHAEGKPGFSGYVVPLVHVEIVDGDGQPVPNGTRGEVRIRFEGQVERYLDDDEATAEAFRDGWFHPGDIGVLGDQGELTLVGRSRELMNLGGLKIAPEAMEEALAGLPGVSDMAVFSAGAEAGGERACVAVVATQGFSEQELQRRCREAYPNLPAMRIFPVERIPRNEMGKVQRSELAALLAGAQGAVAAGRTVH
jgi:acyl-CoA synthetase (AMP-forming)/AMP-acid ligase II